MIERDVGDECSRQQVNYRVNCTTTMVEVQADWMWIAGLRMPISAPARENYLVAAAMLRRLAIERDALQAELRRVKDERDDFHETLMDMKAGEG